MLLNICDIRKHAISRICMDFLSSERCDKLSLNEVILSFNHLGKMCHFSASDKMCEWSLKRGSLKCNCQSSGQS